MTIRAAIWRRLTIITVSAAAIIGSCNFPPKSPPVTEFYVSIKGSDTTGDGSKSKPWRHIQYAIDHANPKAGTSLTLNILKGIYEEKLVIHKPVALIGAGIGTASTWANDPLYPIQEITVISGSVDVDTPDILIENATSVNLQNLVVHFGGIKVVNTRFIMYQVEIPDTRGLYGVQIENSSLFYIEKSQIRTLQNTRADYGIDIMASSGDIWNSYLGDNFDHAINISSTVLGKPAPSPNKAMKIQSVNIYDLTIDGAKIFYADGIRIQGATNVKIINTKITRSPLNAETADSGAPHNPPYAGIEIAGWITPVMGQALVEIEGVTISGFDIGVGMNFGGYNVKAQKNDISGIKYDVETKYKQYTNVGFPVVDFGGGPLGSAGGNDFAKQPPYGFYNNVPYDTYACFNVWHVDVTQVDLVRIYDKIDNPSKGRVQWNCQADVFKVTPTSTRKPTTTPLVPSRVTYTPTRVRERVRIIRDAICYEGPGRNYPVVSAVLQSQTANLMGIGFGGTYYIIENPRFFVPCWIEVAFVEYNGDPGTLRIYAIPPTPTPTKEPNKPDPATQTPSRP
jgi:hypothetical protein